MDKFSIVHISTWDVAGGAEKVAWRLARLQHGLGHSSKILAGFVREISEFSFFFPRSNDNWLNFISEYNGLLYYGIQGSHRLVRDPIVATADIVHLHNLHGDYFNPFSLFLLSRFKPVVWTLHDMQAITGHCAH